MNLSKFLKSAKWVDFCFWLCFGCVLANLAVMFVQAQLHNTMEVRNAGLNMVLCALGVVLNFLRAQKPKAK